MRHELGFDHLRLCTVGRLLPLSDRPSGPWAYPPPGHSEPAEFPGGHPIGLPPSKPHGDEVLAVPGARHGFERVQSHFELLEEQQWVSPSPQEFL